MRTVYGVLAAAAVLGSAWALSLRGEELAITPALQARIDQWKQNAAEWAADPAIQHAVEEQNRRGPIADMTEEKWKNARRRAPEIVAFQTNPVAELLKVKAKASHEIVSEAFVSAARGEKVAFLEKTTSYIHKGKPKFDVPFTTGKPWQGKPEFDESSQTYAIQISVPILAGEKPIGVIVVGLDFSKLQVEDAAKKEDAAPKEKVESPVPDGSPAEGEKPIEKK